MGGQPQGWAILDAEHLFKSVPKLQTQTLVVRSKVFPRKVVIFMVPTPYNQVATPSNFPFPYAYKRDTARGQNRGRESSKKGTMILALGRVEVYKQSYSGPYLLYIHPEAVEALLEVLHEGLCGSHIEGRSLSHRALTQGYWWPSMQKSAQEYVKKCDQCQRYAPNIHQPGETLNPLSYPWPFS